MYYRKHLFVKALFLFIVFLTVLPTAYSQSKADSLLNSGNVLTILETLMKNLPPEKKQAIEESLNSIRSAKPAVQSVILKDKTVCFIPLIHASSAGFYNSVRDIVVDYKSRGYKVYYEQLRSDKHAVADSSRTDTLRLKFRKMIGIEPTRETYSILKKLIPGMMAQPEYKDLGVTETDLNADVTVRQMVDKYEALYGEIKLTPCDFETKFGTITYPCEKLDNDKTPVVINFRNEYVAELIKNSKDNKILVLYGASHIKGMTELIQR